MNYWLSPTGRVVNVRESDHNEMAEALLSECDFSFENRDTAVTFTEYLESLGWARYCDWTTNPRWVVEPSRRLTSAQIGAMYELTGYFHEEERL